MKKLSAILDSVLPEYQKISKAPSASTMQGWSKVQIYNERQKLYKSIDSQGNIWLVGNHNAWDMSSFKKRYQHLRTDVQRKMVIAAADVKKHITRLS